MYKKASQIGLRIQTNKGPLSVEQLWHLNQTDLKDAIKSVKQTLKKENDDDLSFLGEATVVDSENQLKFDILKDIYVTKKEAIEAVKTAAANKAHNAKIDALIAEKQEGSLKELSIGELEALRK